MDDKRNPPCLRQRLREVIRTRHYSRRTEQSYWYWIRFFILFHGLKHPAELGEREVQAFLTWLATERNVAVATQNQALNAPMFLYRHVLGTPLGEIGDVAFSVGGAVASGLSRRFALSLWLSVTLAQFQLFLLGLDRTRIDQLHRPTHRPPDQAAVTPAACRSGTGWPGRRGGWRIQPRRPKA